MDPATTITITYLANEGVFLSDGSSGVLIDSLFREGVEGYARLAPDVLEAVETAAAPFDSTRLVLVTHRHRDHFQADSVARHMQHNTRAMLVAPANAAELVEAAARDFASFRDRARFLPPPRDSVVTVHHAGLSVEVFFVSHGQGRFAKVENLGYVVTIGGKRVLHLGDAELGDGAYDPVKRFANKIDIACVPYWWLVTRSGRECVAAAFPDARLVAIHIEPAKAARITEQIKKHFPDAIVLTTPLLSARF